MQGKVKGPDSCPGEKHGLQNHQEAGDAARGHLYNFPRRVAEQSWHTVRVYKASVFVFFETSS